MELKLGTKCSLKHLKAKNSDIGVVGKIIGYSEKYSGGVVRFCTPGGTIIETGLLWLSVLNKEEKKLIRKYEKDSLKTRGAIYDDEVIY